MYLRDDRSLLVGLYGRFPSILEEQSAQYKSAKYVIIWGKVSAIALCAIYIVVHSAV